MMSYAKILRNNSAAVLFGLLQIHLALAELLRTTAAACVNVKIPEEKRQSARAVIAVIMFVFSFFFFLLLGLNLKCYFSPTKTLAQHDNTIKTVKDWECRGLLNGFLLGNCGLGDGGGLLWHGGYDPWSHFIMFWAGGSGWRRDRGIRSGWKIERGERREWVRKRKKYEHEQVYVYQPGV